MNDEAIGAWEASALMGLHWSRPAKMAEAGTISSRVVGSTEERTFAVYSRAECEQNYKDYMANRVPTRRPRTALDNRPDILRVLGQKDRPKIAYGDAISVYEAAKILGVWWTLVPRLAKDGKIVGRVLHSGRQNSSRLWVISRQSCETHGADVSRQEQAGTKRGRPRTAC
jgi:hypothetical protein